MKKPPNSKVPQNPNWGTKFYKKVALLLEEDQPQKPFLQHEIPSEPRGDLSIGFLIRVYQFLGFLLPSPLQGYPLEELVKSPIKDKN